LDSEKKKEKLKLVVRLELGAGGSLAVRKSIERLRHRKI
jgi:hypothetical protein